MIDRRSYDVTIQGVCVCLYAETDSGRKSKKKKETDRNKRNSAEIRFSVVDTYVAHDFHNSINLINSIKC